MNMLAHWELDIKTDGESKPSVEWGPMLHGTFLDLWPYSYFNRLHSEKPPFSQYIECLPNGQAVWHINLYGSVFDNLEVERTLSSLTERTLFSTDKFRERIIITDRRQDVVNAEELWKGFLNIPNTCRICQVRFKTPCTHKSKGKYVVFPSPMYMLNNLQNRIPDIYIDWYRKVGKDIKLLANAVSIRRHSLYTEPYHIQKAFVVGYRGTVELELPTDTYLRQQACILLGLSSFIGIGVKTAMGMGAVDIAWQ